MTCEHKRTRSHGKTSSGRPRTFCLDCRRTWTHGPKAVGNLGADREKLLQEMLANGESIRTIAKAVGCCKETIASRRAARDFRQPVEQAAEDECDYCGRELVGERRFHRRKTRTHHKFCDETCYQGYMYWRRMMQRNLDDAKLAELDALQKKLARILKGKGL